MSAAPGRPYTRPLDRLRSPDEPSFGGKSSALGELLGAGIPVPAGFALGISALDQFIDETGLEQVVERALAGVPGDDIGEIAAASRAIADGIRAAPLPAAVASELTEQYHELAARAENGSPPVAVRSSAVGEDSGEATFAGQQQTQLWVRGVEDLFEAVRDCWASLYSTEAITYRRKLGAGRRPAMGVTVQLMVDAAISGVMFTCNPVSGDPSMVAINASWGLGLAIVGGEVTPDDYLVSKITGELVREQVGSKHMQCVVRADGRGTELVPVPEQRRELACLDPRALAELVAIAGAVQRHFGSHQDIEWAIADPGALPESLFVVQSRPVTGPAKPERSGEPPPSALSLVMGTFGARPPAAGEERR